MKKKPTLLFCIAMDAIGMVSFIFPGLGEFTDIVWAPLSAFIFFRTFGGKKGVIGGIISFIEEALPFIDIIPTFTIAWIYTRYFKTQPPDGNAKKIIDI